jgi:hypothetical protein
VLHIGTHKTGTKSLQRMLAHHATWFADQGLYYPVAGQVDGGHHNIAWQLLGDPRFDPANGSLDDLVVELDRHEPPNVLLSSEDLESLYRRERPLARFRSALNELDYEVEVVVLLRHPSDYVPSLYQELVLHGFEQPLDEFVECILKNGGVMFRQWDLRLNYQQLVAGFADVFGVASVHALRYEQRDSVATVLDAVSEILGLSIGSVAGWTRHNTGLDRATDGRLSGCQAEAIDAAFGSFVNDVVHRYPVR